MNVSERSEKIRQIWFLATRKEVVSASFKIAVIVGTILNLINQGDYILRGEGIMLSHLILNYIVPFIVATTSAVMTQLKQLVDCRVDFEGRIERDKASRPNVF